MGWEIEIYEASDHYFVIARAPHRQVLIPARELARIARTGDSPYLRLLPKAVREDMLSIARGLSKGSE